jgi:hypothetical protein
MTYTMANQTIIATAELATPELTAAKVASQLKAMEAMNNAATSPWISGLAHSTYTDCYDSATGELKLFMNKAQTKVAGRIVLDKEGRERKLYHGFINLLNGIGGVTSVLVKDAEGVEHPFTSIEGAQFGVFAVQSSVDTDQNDNNGNPYKRVDHYLQKTVNQAKPEPATV